ncbi:30S ribosomal protein S2 [Methylacidimicrobium cyclopophantes]|uniref:Small ribosomal subunit protein uS2 n=1 Tax=Methylacidimicrobium cyclopophantes TaxID=1041766 RepID=A0A5E6MH70_9BACT|nr:30S ribosomal protein S2 [Methylacidimicrobium cyclopophantes]VVM08453.1 30S ribosomal protein S2 [Methylacidimicrobium cyclopophantes]
MVDVKALVEAGVHFGHRTDKWHPRMKRYLAGSRGGIHWIDPEKTREQLENAARFLEKLSESGGKALFVGCKRQAQPIVQECAEGSESFYVNHRWLGGTLTNLVTIRKSVERMRWIDHLEEKGLMDRMPKKEVAVLRRENAKLRRHLWGIRGMERIPEALIVVDVVREAIAVSEAKKLRIPIVAIVDTNADPEGIDFPIPANDDSIRSIRLILRELNQSIIEGKTRLGWTPPVIAAEEIPAAEPVSQASLAGAAS